LKIASRNLQKVEGTVRAVLDFLYWMTIEARHFPLQWALGALLLVGVALGLSLWL
jgi:hypothetical protein